MGHRDISMITIPLQLRVIESPNRQNTNDEQSSSPLQDSGESSWICRGGLERESFDTCRFKNYQNSVTG